MAGELFVLFLLFPGQRFFLARSLTHSAFRMMFVQAGITAISQGLDVRMDTKFAFLKEAEVVPLTVGAIGANNLRGLLVDNDLRFQGVSLLFAGVVVLLPVVSVFDSFPIPHFFLGLSIGDSDASIRMTSNS